MNWLDAQATETQQNETQESYLQFYETIDTILMGRYTYEQITQELSPDFWPYKDKKTYVFTHKPQEYTEDVQFTDRNPEEFLQWLKHRKGGNIWLCGGADLIAQCLAQGLIHRYHLSIQPILLGSGLRLFPENHQQNHLQLVSSQQKGANLEVIYESVT